MSTFGIQGKCVKYNKVTWLNCFHEQTQNSAWIVRCFDIFLLKPQCADTFDAVFEN